MNFKSGIFTVFSAVVLLACSGIALATPIKATYTVSLNTSDPGLVVDYADVADNPFSFDLAPGQTKSGSLFNIWTDEGSVNGDDEASSPISVNFHFILPGVFDGSVNGTTQGEKLFFGAVQYGKLTWDGDGTTELDFGPKGDGHLQIKLDDATFNTGFLGTRSGKKYGATVRGHVTLIADASVPEPGVLVVFGLGLLGLGLAVRRRSRGR
jgi:hypothetical protein